MSVIIAVVCLSLVFICSNAHETEDFKLLESSFADVYGDNSGDQAHKSPITKRQNLPWYVNRNQAHRPLNVPVRNLVPRLYRPTPYIAQRAQRLPVHMPVARANIIYRRPNIRYPPFRYSPPPYALWMQRSRTPRYNPRYNRGPALYNRGWTVSGKMLNANTGTNSHTVSNSVLKAPGHTQTNTHVINKQHTGGGIRRMFPAVPVQYYRYPYMRLNNMYARGRVAASARVNAKASSGSSSASKSQSSSSTNGGARTTASGGGWGAGAGAGYGTGPGAWGIGYGGGAGGSAGSIPSGLKGIPGMASGYPGIPSGFPGMPPGGFPGQSSGHYAGAKGVKARKPTSVKGKGAAMKPRKGIDASLKASKANQIKQSTYNKPKYQLKRLKAYPMAIKNRQQNRKNFSPRTMIPAYYKNPMPVYRIQYFSGDATRRPTNQEWFNIRQRIISNVIHG